jgi:cytochrome c-type biogenesis protein CcmH/NrfF
MSPPDSRAIGGHEAARYAARVPPEDPGDVGRVGGGAPAAFGFLTLILALLASVPATAADPETPAEPAGWAHALSRDMMSPFCPGRSLADCPSPQAESLRLWIVVQESTGRSRADVEAELYERYGDTIRGAPRAEGWGLSAYAIPVLAFAAGGVLVVAFLRRRTRVSSDAVAAPALDPELARIVDRELEGGSR